MGMIQEGSIILKMRNTFLLLKDSLLELVKRSTDSTDSPEHEDSDAQTQFYKEWIQCGHLAQCDIKTVQRKPRVFFKRSYAVYVVQVRSDVVLFETRKRYSQFEQFYQRCKRHAVLSASFPPRTVLQPGWSEDVTRLRILQLNNILSEVTSSKNTALLVEIFSFLGLYDHCPHMQLRPKESSLSVTDEFLMQELSKLNDNPANILEGMRRIQQSLTQRKKRLPYEVARQLLVGGEEDEGLLSLVMSNENELVVSEGLKLLNWLVSPETNKDWQAFRRALFKCQPTKIVLENEETRLNSEVCGEYFKFLSFYLSGRQEQDLQQVAECYSESSRFSQEFTRWAKYNSLCSA